MKAQALGWLASFLILSLGSLTGCSVGGSGGVFGAHDSSAPSSTRGYTLQDKIVSSGGGRYTQRIDSLPPNPQDVSNVPDASPVPEPRSRRGNASSYTVFGRTYRVMESSQGFVQTGIASWYGNKFHGHETSNGEIYDMYAMTAAHTSLPLPTFVRVTNLDNQRQVIVRVNDRGPFVGNRVIDLSYAAAYRLDMIRTGTARVRVEAIDPVQWQAQQRRAPPPAQPPAAAAVNTTPSSQPARNGVVAPGDAVFFLQVAALSNAESAQQLRNRVAAQLSYPTRILPADENRPFYRVQVGPMRETSVEAAMQTLRQNNLGQPLLIRP